MHTLSRRTARLFLVRLNSGQRRALLASTIVLSVAIGLIAIASGPAGGNTQDNLSVGGKIENGYDRKQDLKTIAGIALVAPPSPSGSVPPEEASRGAQIGLLTYIVEEGDTVSTIAEEYGVSTNTILWENNITRKSILKPGMKLSILPIDGVKHTVEEGDTVSGIASQYESDIETILTYNILEADEILTIGDNIIVPNGTPKSSRVSVSSSGSQQSTPAVSSRSLIDVSGYFVMPVSGRRTQGLHRYNAVDLGGSDYCGTSVQAAAEGTVTASRGGWNGGYGNYVKISHPNGTVTLYAHNAQNLVSVGESVTQGQTIALLGSTGNSTGCHVHFEVRGARNPFSS